jgi:methionine synthase I (cobalamin-dependent)
MNLLTAIRQRRIFFDGAMGTMLQDAGLPAGGFQTCGVWSGPNRCAPFMRHTSPQAAAS